MRVPGHGSSKVAMRKVPPRFGVWATAGPGRARSSPVRAPVAAAAPPSFRRSRRLTVERSAMESSFGQGILRQEAVSVEKDAAGTHAECSWQFEGPEHRGLLPQGSQAEVAATLWGDGRDVKIDGRFVEQVPEVLRHLDLAADDPGAIPL